MFEILKQKIIAVVEIVHRWVFGHEISLTMKDFLRQLSWSFFGIFFNGIVLFIVNVLAGRILGPEGYGKYNLVLVVANILSIFVLLGLDTTSIKYISSSQKEEDKKQYLSNSFYIILSSSFLLIVFSVFFYFQIAQLLNFDQKIFLLAVVFAIVANIRTLLDSFIKSFNFFKFQSFLKIVEGVVILFVFVLLFFILKFNDYQYYLISLIAGYFVLGLIFFLKIRPKLVTWNKQKFLKIIQYSKITIILFVITIVMSSIDKIFIEKTLGIEKLGIYSAYLVSTSVFVGQIILIFNNVFFPIVNQIEDKSVIIKKVDKLLFLGLIPGTFVMFLFSYGIMNIFGKEYQLNVFYIMAFSAMAFLQFMSSLYKSIISCEEKNYLALKKVSYVMLFLFFIMYGMLFIAKVETLTYFVLLYCLYNIVNVLIIRRSYGK
ncbi:MAG: oligosaccharide flippase family protein [Parcubacteria group bacterium]|jgi:O-antigen/teichoic acid export membrane protein